VMFAMARGAGKGAWDAVSYASYGLIPWSIWALMLGWMRRSAGEYHPAVGETPLDPMRRRMAFGVLIIFILIATPVPFRPVL
jgi:hypothetical protein